MAKILLADDAPDIRMMVRILLSADSLFELVGEATNAAEVIALAETTQPDIVILDQGFGDKMTGLQAAPLIKQSAPKTKIILFSAYQDVEGVARNVEAIDRFVLKTDAHKLSEVARELLEQED